MAANTCISSSKIREKFNLTLEEGISMATTADARVTVSISKNDVVAFLNLAATDDAFRKRLQANPTAVLAEHSIFLPPSAKVAASPAQLPSKEALHAVLEDIKKGKPPTVTAEDSHWVFLAFLAFL